MDRNEILARHIMEKTAAAPVRDYFREGYLKGYMHKEAAIDWAGLLKGVKEGAGKVLPKNPEEWVQTLGGAGVGALAGGALGGWKGALGGGLLGGTGGLVAARHDMKMPGLDKLTTGIMGAGKDIKDKVNAWQTERGVDKVRNTPNMVSTKKTVAKAKNSAEMLEKSKKDLGLPTGGPRLTEAELEPAGEVNT